MVYTDAQEGDMVEMVDKEKTRIVLASHMVLSLPLIGLVLMEAIQLTLTWVELELVDCT